MALKYPDRIESNNPQAYGIVKATEVSGAKNAAEYGGLLDIPDNILSASGDGSDALYLLWIDDNSVYRLVDWNNRHNSKGWQIEYAYIPWDSTAHLNSLTLSGQYYLTGQSNGLNGGLPILNSNPGHTFDAVLRVLDSSLTKNENEKLLCITLILSLSNRMGGDGHIFVRTIQTLEKNNLTRTDIESPTCDKWSSWEKLLGIIEKNVVELPVHLNTYTTNGMYSGVFVNPDRVGDLQIKAFDTFLLITVNGYAAAGVALLMGLNKAPQLTQLLYITPIETGLAVLYTRTATLDGSLWVFDKFYKLATNEDTDRLNTEIVSVKNTTKEVTDNIRNLALFQFTINPTENNVRFVTSNLEDAIVGGVDMLPASTTLAGVMSAEDKIKLDSVESMANGAKSAAQEAKNAAETAQSTATAAQTKNTEQDARLDNIEARIEPDIAGRVWNEDNGTPKAESYYGSVKALRDLPKRLGLGRYIVKDDRTRRKLDPNDSTKYLDGTPAKLDGTDGQCMWCWNGFYANIWHEGSRLIKAVTFDGPVGNDISIWIPAGGISWLGAGVIDRGDAPYTDKTKWKLCSVINNSEQFRGGDGTALDASKFSKAPADTTPQITMLGMPATNISTTDFGNYARRRNEGWEANWFVARFVVEFLFEIIMGTENSQEAFNNLKDADGLYQGGFGTGVTDMPDWGIYNGTYPVIPTSVGLEAGDGVCLVEYKLPQTNGVAGDTYNTFNVPVFFGLVGAGFGNLWQWTRGLIIDAGDKSLVYVTTSMYADYDPNTVTDKILVAECPQTEGYIKRKSYQGLCCMPTEVGGTPTTRFGDYFGTNAATSKGLRVRAVGGNADSGTYAGASYTYVSRTAIRASASYSSPLCYFEEDPVIPETQSIVQQ